MIAYDCCCSVAQLCPTLCDPIDCGMPGFPVPHHLLGFAQVRVHCHQWCHPAISSSVTLFFCLQSFPASGSFSMSWLFKLGNQSIGASASVLPMSIQYWFPLGLTGLISLLSKGLIYKDSSTKSLLQHYSLTDQFFGTLPSLLTMMKDCYCHRRNGPETPLPFWCHSKCCLHG